MRMLGEGWGKKARQRFERQGALPRPTCMPIATPGHVHAREIPTVHSFPVAQSAFMPCHSSHFIPNRRVSARPAFIPWTRATPRATPHTHHGMSAQHPAPHRTRKGILALDLDETLVHATAYPVVHGNWNSRQSASPGLEANVLTLEVMINGHPTLYHVYKRPYVDVFLRHVSQWYHLVLYTASLEEYASPVFDWLLRSNGLLDTGRIPHGRSGGGLLSSYLAHPALGDGRRTKLVPFMPWPLNCLPIPAWLRSIFPTRWLGLPAPRTPSSRGTSPSRGSRPSSASLSGSPLRRKTSQLAHSTLPTSTPSTSHSSLSSSPSEAGTLSPGNHPAIKVHRRSMKSSTTASASSGTGAEGSASPRALRSSPSRKSSSSRMHAATSDRPLRSRLYRQDCYNLGNGVYTKPLEYLSPNLANVVLLDNSPVSFLACPNNAVPIASWIDDADDEQLLDLLPFLDALSCVEDVRSVLSLGQWKGLYIPGDLAPGVQSEKPAGTVSGTAL
jgi:hypothetical protein